MLLKSFLKRLFFRAVSVSQQNGEERSELPSALPPLMLSLTPAPVIITQRLQCTSGFFLGVAHSRGFDKCVMTCGHHCRIVQSGFTAEKHRVLRLHPHPAAAPCDGKQAGTEFGFRLCECPAIPAPCLGKAVLSLVRGFCSFVRDQLSSGTRACIWLSPLFPRSVPAP